MSGTLRSAKRGINSWPSIIKSRSMRMSALTLISFLQAQQWAHQAFLCIVLPYCRTRQPLERTCILSTMECHSQVLQLSQKTSNFGSGSGIERGAQVQYSDKSTIYGQTLRSWNMSTRCRRSVKQLHKDRLRRAVAAAKAPCPSIAKEAQTSR
jgi:hypothetical protein